MHVHRPRLGIEVPSYFRMREHSSESAISVKTFFILAFAIGWGLAILMLIFLDQVEAVFGKMSGTNPVFVLVVYSPAIAAVYLIWRHYGFRSLKSYFQRVTLWQLPGRWWLFLLIGIPAAKYLGAALNGKATEFPFSPWYDVLPAFAAAMFIGPIEEFGWRGLALPLLQRRYVPLTASLILGAFWGLWHAPAFLMSDTPQSAWSFGPYVIGVVSLAVILTPIFNAAHGSILIAMIYHLQMNGPAWPEAQPWENFIFAAIAIVIVAYKWREMTTPEEAATSVFVDERVERGPTPEPATRVLDSTTGRRNPL